MKNIPFALRHIRWSGLRPIHKWALSMILTLLATGVTLLYIAPLFFSLPEGLTKAPEPGLSLTDRNGTPLRRLLNKDLAIDAPATLEEIPIHLIEATLSVEDARFRQHNGIDSLGVMRAGYDSIRARRLVSGASTISQQLIKITSAEKPRNARTKIIEIFTARKLEMSWSKDEILAAYLNRLPYGNLLTGCRAAARGYFNKPLSDLSLAECSLLAGLPNRPSYLNPHRHFESAKKRQQWVLKRMLVTDKITQEQYQHAIHQPIQLQAVDAFTFEAPHLVELILNKPELAGQTSSSSHARIKTTIDLPLQHFVEQNIRTNLQKLEQKSRHESSLQAATVVIDNASGEVLTLVGSRGFFDSGSGQINGAWKPRSPGSALKPFTYLMALERGETAGTIIDDLPLEFMTPTGAYRPVNYDRHFRGPVTLREALATSLNVPAIRTLDDLGGPSTLHPILLNLGLTTLTQSPSHYGLGLTIGTAEVRLLELANAYACLARLGQYADYRLVSQTQAKPLTTHNKFSPDVCYIIADILSDPQARMSAFGLNSALDLPFKVACKTGTSTDFRDNWTIGYTPQYTVGVWVGCFDNQAMPRISGVIGAGPIFHDIFMQLYSNPASEPIWYQQPDHIVSARIDPLNGKRIPENETVGNFRQAQNTRMEIFRSQNLPPLASIRDYDFQGRTFLPTHYAPWFSAGNHSLQDRAAIRPATSDPSTSGAPFEILSPLSNTVIYLDADLPNGGRFFSLLTTPSPSELIWTCPTLKIESKQNNTPFAILEPGTHLLTVTDSSSGYSTSITVKVESL